MFRILLLIFLSVGSAFSANILHIATLASPSHHIWNRVLALGLADKGHNVTYLSFDSDSFKTDNYTFIPMEGAYEAIERDYRMVDVPNRSTLEMIYDFIEFTEICCGAYIKSKGLQTLLNYPEDFFDLIIFDVTAGGCLFPVIQRFGYPPAVAVTPFLLAPFVEFNFGNHLYPAYVPYYDLPYTNQMTFFQRVWNFIFMYADAFIRLPTRQTKLNNQMKQVFGEDTATVAELERHFSLVLANIDPILNFPQPLAPNIIPVGGLNSRKGNPLPQDLAAIVDNSKNGVVVFSLGTNVRSDKLEKVTKKAILEAFSQLKETVIWKFESQIDNLPKNVIIRKFLPQNDLFAHPNVKLFIGHGGALSTTEAIYHGVPMVVIPFFLDQRISARNIAERKLGVTLDFRKITTSDYFLKGVREVLDNPEYSENMIRMSELFKDRPETPLERGIFWIEYALRHGGADFLNTPARDLPFYVSSSLDVVLFLSLVALLVIIAFVKLIKLIFSVLIVRKKVKTN